MKKFFAVAALALLSQASFASEGWSADPDPYQGPVYSPVWFDCGVINGMSVRVMNSLNLVLTDARGNTQTLPLRATGGLFARDYVTPDGQLVLKARISQPYIANAQGQLLSYCSSVNSGGGGSGYQGDYAP